MPTTDDTLVEWHILRGDKQCGPYSFSVMLQAVEGGILLKNDFVWRPGWQAWRPAHNVSGLFTPPALNEHTNHANTRAASDDPSSQLQTELSIPPNDLAIRKSKQESPARRPNYFVRHWRGDLSLPVAYWINNIVYTIIVYMMVFGILAFMEANKDIGSLGVIATLSTFLIAFAAVSLWQMVGVWRSASHHTSRGGKAFWAGLAKLMVCLGAIRILFDLSTFFMPIISEYVRIALGDDQYGEHNFRILRNGTELELSGGINVGTAKDFAQIINAASQVTTLHLNSIGGRVAEADEIATQVLKHRLITYVSDQCVSACTHIFLAGRERWLGERARLGFHRPDFPGLRDEDQIPIIQQERRYLLSLGLPPDFVNKALSTPSSSIWWPDRSELLSAHIISGVADSSRFAASGSFASTAASDHLTEGLMKIPVYAALKQADPKQFDAMVSRLSEGYRKGETEDAIMSSVRSLFAQIIKQYIPRASDDLLFGITDVYIEYMQALKSADPETCVALLDDSKGAHFRTDLYRQFPQIAKRELAINEAIISFSGQELRIPTEKQVQPQLERVVRELTRQMGNDVGLLNKPTLEMTEYKRYCDVAIAMYQEIKRLPKQQSTDLLRYFYNDN